MSVPFLTFNCNACGYQKSSFVATGRFLWTHNGSLFNFFPTLGVCKSCYEIVAIEGIPDKSTFIRAKQLHRQGSKSAAWLFDKDPAKKLAYQNSFAILELVMKQGRKPVCLSCGSPNCQKIDIPKIYQDSKISDISPSPIGIQHPGCHGELYVEGSGTTRMHVMPKTHYFGIKGNYITTLHGREGHLKLE